MTNIPWECPRCKRINTPTTPRCDCKVSDLQSTYMQPITDYINSYRCSNCGGYHGNFNGKAVQCVNLSLGFPVIT